jgi:hypothetical protein
MLTSLILGGPCPKWNTESDPSKSGAIFLSCLHRLAFGTYLVKPLKFIDEFDLPALSINEKGGYPDYAVKWNNHLWIIELKTESTSHRKDQLPLYLELANNHYPDCNIEILYLTPKMNRIDNLGSNQNQFKHLFWSEVTPIISEIWENSIHQEERLLESAIQREVLKLTIPANIFWDNALSIREAINQSISVQENGIQQAVEVKASGLYELHEFRVRIRDALNRLNAENTVKPWIWCEKTSGGKALTDYGAKVGFEIRLSRHN